MRVRARHSPDDIHARITRRAFGQPFCRDILHFVPKRFQLVTNQLGAHGIILARWIDGRYAHELLQELNQLIGELVYVIEYVGFGGGEHVRQDACPQRQILQDEQDFRDLQDQLKSCEWTA